MGKTLRQKHSEVVRKQYAAERIVTIPRCANRARRTRLEANDIVWLMHYFGAGSGCESPFTYEFTVQQREMAAAIRAAVFDGGDQCIAASRGEGKTTIFERLLTKYSLEGKVKFAVLFAATGAAAQDSLDSIKTELENNDRLLADYPEVCVPVRALENTPQRAHFQIANGFRHDTRKPFETAAIKFSWCGQEISFPKVPGSPSAGAVIGTRGLDSAVRGVKKKGKRVDVACIDDPDTEETARSAEQAKKLEDRIDRAIAGLGSQTRRVARVMLTTLQNRNCVSYRFTDPQIKPSWNGRRFRFLIEKPTHAKLWEQYVELRKDDWRNKQHGLATTTAHEFYVANREAMDLGAVVANPNRYNQGELSALQFYYNEVARIGQEAVSTEYDNDPPDEAAGASLLTREQICAKQNGYERGLVPRDVTQLTAFIDVQGRMLWWSVVGWCPNFSGYVIDYGGWPKQRRTYYTLADAVPAIPDLCPGGFEASIHAALTNLVNELCGREWLVDGGGSQKISRLLVDANWGESTPTVYSFCRQSPHAAILIPTHGRGVKASGSPIMLWPKQDGEQVGLNWRIRRTTKSHAPVRHGVYDTNFWKSFLHARLFVPLGGAGSLSLFKSGTHQMLADHLHAEYPVLVSAQGREVNEWQARPNHPDNHLFDCLVGCCVAGSMLGVALPSDSPARSRPKPSQRPTAAQLAKRNG